MTSRRQFIRNTVVAASVPFMLPSRIWSADIPPSERISLGFIGMGRKNMQHLLSFLGREEVIVRAVCDVDTTRREYAKGQVDKAYGNGDCLPCNEFEAMLARDDIDAVVIATPDHWHACIAIAAANAGKDVYCEKPLTHNIHEALELVNAVRKNKRVLQTGSQQRSSKEFRVAAELVRNGVIGKIDRVDVSFGDPVPKYDFPEEAMEPGLDWDRWCGPGPLMPYNSELSPRGVHNHFPNWRKTREFGGGAITDWGAHHIDIAHWGLGEDARGPVEVHAPKAGAKRGARLIYKGGIPLTHVTGKGVSFFGSDGEVHVNRGKFEFVLDGKTIHRFWDKQADTGMSLDRAVILTEREFLQDARVKLHNSKNHHDDWLHSIRTREKPIADVAIGASTVIAAHLMNMGYWYGAHVKWDPIARKFIKGGTAAWLTREYRGEWKV